MMNLTAILILAAGQDLGPKPGKEHDVLKQFAGEWDYTSKFIMAPGQEPMVSKGKESARMIGGGLFLVFDVEGEMMGSKFVGHGTMGYDGFKKKYTGSWIDSMATGHYTVEGTADEAGKVLTETMEGADPQSGEPLKMKLVHEIKGKDSRVLKFYVFGPDGNELEIGSIEYTRKK